MKLSIFLIIFCLYSLNAMEASCSSYDNERYGHSTISVTVNDCFYSYINNLPDENNTYTISHHSMQAGHSHQKHSDCSGKDSQRTALLGSLKYKNVKKNSLAISIKLLNILPIFTQANNFSDYHPALSIKRLPLHILNMVFLV